MAMEYEGLICIFVALDGTNVFSSELCAATKRSMLLVDEISGHSYNGGVLPLL